MPRSNHFAKNIILDCLTNRNARTQESIELTLTLLQIAIDHKIFNPNLVDKFTTKGNKMISILLHDNLFGNFITKGKKLVSIAFPKESSLSGKEMLELYKKDLEKLIISIPGNN